MPNQINEREVSLANLPPTPAQSRLALAITVALLVAFGVTAPFANLEVRRIDAFIPIVQATMFVTDFTTSALLFAQFSVSRSRGLLALANGYLFAALMIISYLLTFPKVFMPTGLFGAGLQTPVWLYLFWHLGLPSAICAYVWLARARPTTPVNELPARFVIGLSVAIVITLACSFTVVATAGHDFLPRLFLDQTNYAPLSFYVAAINILFGLFVFVVLWVHRRSILDLWLTIVMLAWIAEYVMVALLSSARFDLGWYAGRVYSLITATVVLAVLLAEVTRLYARLAHSNRMLRRERDNTLMNLETMTASIAHEVRQPLSVISVSSSTALRFLDRTPPDLEEARSDLNTIASQTELASQVFENLRALFGKGKQAPEQIDMNQIVAAVLRSLDGELKDHGVTTRIELTTELPRIVGHRGQLQEVLFNLVRNAIDAMAGVKDGHRFLQVKTEKPRRDAIAVIVEDSGPGIDPEKLDTLFEAFVTTKSQGMGLGLAICRTIIERHGGQLSASSSEASGGALFQMILPITAPPHEVG